MKEGKRAQGILPYAESLSFLGRFALLHETTMILTSKNEGRSKNNAVPI